MQTGANLKIRTICGALILWCGLFVGGARAEKMPVKHLTTSDGLPQNTIRFVHQDRRGFFWIGTDGGLARFDGYEFVNFTKEKGLPRNEVLDILETGDGFFWLATKSGLVKFAPDGKIYPRVIESVEAAALADKPAFVTFPIGNPKAPTVTKLLSDSRGTFWIGTEQGLFQMRENNQQIEFARVDLNLPPNDSTYIHQLYEDRRGAVWIGTNNNLIRIFEASTAALRMETDAVFSALLEDRAGHFWVGTQHQGLFLFTVDARGAPQIVKQFARQTDSEVEWIDAIVEAANGNLWIGGINGLAEFTPSSEKLFRYTRSSGLGLNRVRSLLTDRGGDLWLGTGASGVFRVAADGLISFDTADRISFVRSVGLDANKNLLLTAFVTNTELDAKGAKVERDIGGKIVPAYEWRVGKLDEKGFSWLVPKFPRPINFYGWGNNQQSLQTRGGEWWIVTGEGLFRFPPVEFADLPRTAPVQIFDQTNGLNPAAVFRIFEDSLGNVWIATSGEQTNGFYRWERRTAKLQAVADFTDYNIKNLINFFAEDSRQNLWFAAGEGFGRLRNGKIEFFTPDEKQTFPPGGIMCLFFDRENRLWAATRQGGVVRIDNPFAETLKFHVYTENAGLSSNRTLSVTQDKQGLIYIGTDRDISRLNPATGEFKVLKLGRSQLQREYRSAICDADGALWFGTTEGLVKYVPQPDKPAPLPEILITGVQIEGAAQTVSAIGASEITLPTLEPQQNQIRIDYVSLANFADENVVYQYKLAQDSDWSPPNKERFVNFANLSAGKYQVLIRAATTGGNVSEKPAVVTFQILAPFYLRAWFLALAAIISAAAIYFLYRYRVRKLLEIERARTLIATDLHDDIGSNLSKISVLSEIVRMQISSGDAEQNRLLDSIARISRESVGSMSDIVWAINPKRDSLAEMIGKMRVHAEESLSPKSIKLNFDAAPVNSKIKVSMQVRRDLYLIFKEAVNNILKHSGATAVSVEFAIDRYELILTISDDGRGFAPSPENGGNGLTNMQTRVAKLKGKFECQSEIGSGTTITVRVPAS